MGGEYFFIDLVFYHRILKFHILVELKVDEAKHEHIGQLKTYVNYYKREIMQEENNPPVGLLLVTNQNRALVEYAIADSDQQLFVSKYLLELPSEEELIAEIEREKMYCANRESYMDRKNNENENYTHIISLTTLILLGEVFKQTEYRLGFYYSSHLTNG
nr:PDDEXK nuclease domain-containing protein [Sphingobacterium sp. SYP-B4668]